MVMGTEETTDHSTTRRGGTGRRHLGRQAGRIDARLGRRQCGHHVGRGDGAAWGRTAMGWGSIGRFGRKHRCWEHAPGPHDGHARQAA